jgi:hypothetical protein
MKPVFVGMNSDSFSRFPTHGIRGVATDFPQEKPRKGFLGSADPSIVLSRNGYP